MSIFSTARQIYLVAKDDPTLAAKVRAERSSLALSFVDDPGALFELTSSTVNGQSFSGELNMTKKDKLAMLGQVVAMLDAESSGNIDSRARFSD